ncbi:MAG: Zn-dependent hydrolase [Ignavibacteria bacterium CG22_combo_CG10-13_8_21_14_all_37_15]|nr:MAG: Zn-dependent hydrolase [Ignavibacteria bacterium CG22_combo_CG10-13_8_21_14_all_37_15]PIS44893.1 MAG: Zn-dependent hydrolase [Ignavibacteria bacterium CG08_land_8_20_14_0_20_37_9]PIX93963.1 MAG: Zn-dependent hydrolase [Ignavibacteria bacterium CG_4_10_14_3_um_filter_37_18]PJC57731.1 MAG: Zn-dependent hydrolase [Ignavibacteria bacterium CG_4_9_14_0_2_um_filter_37_13]
MKRRTFVKRTFKLSVGAFLFSPLMTKKYEISAAKPLFKPQPDLWKENELNIAWLGHSTILLSFYGKIILTDPVLLERIGVYFLGITYGPSRFTAPALTVEEIPKPDLLLLSHAHMDHMDYQTLKQISERFPNQIDCLTAYNTADVIEDLEWKSLKEIDWTETTEINEIKIKALETKHFGWRFPWERDRSKGFMQNGRSYNAYILERNGMKILFGGDTAMTDKFKKSNESVDIAIMPIGAYNPWKFNHCTPEEALQMANELNAKVFIPIHTYTFKQGIEPIEEPLSRLMASYKDYDMVIGIKQIGETFSLSLS